MTCGVIMFYYAQHTRQVTDFAGIKGPSKIGRRGHLAAARAVNELCDAVARLAPAAASQHYDCLTVADILQRINDKSATMTTSAVVAIADGAKTDYATVYDNKLTRSVKYYRALQAESEKRGGGFRRGIPFHVYIPL